MEDKLPALIAGAASIGFVHTLVGPDHYLPFIVLSKSRGWSVRKTTVITLLCGAGHVASSVLLGAIGIAAGIALGSLELTESVRGEVAAWLLTAFGLVYLVWGIRAAVRNRPHTHRHAHLGSTEHGHEHTHDADHAHPHDLGRKALTPWVLFVIFVLGPCECLIPFLMLPASAQSLWGLVLVTSVFAVVTISTMLAVVLLSVFGLARIPSGLLVRYGHALAGATITACGVAIHVGL